MPEAHPSSSCRSLLPLGRAVRRVLLLVLMASATGKLNAQEVSIPAGDPADLELHGTLLEPEVPSRSAILILAGSGQTDRDGNTRPTYVHDGLRKLAEELTDRGFVTLRYDKRGVGESVAPSLSAEGLRFEHYANDAARWIAYLKDRYEDVTVVGHSQGALVAMLALQQEPADRLVSLAGLSEDAYTTVRRQLAAQPDQVTRDAYPILDRLREGEKTDSVPAYLNSLFDPRIQDYFISFMQYDPREEIARLRMPILVVQGTTDLQITVDGARAMSRSAIAAEVEIIEGMNHVLRSSSLGPQENMATYARADLPLHDDLVEAIAAFAERDPWYAPLLALVGRWQVDGQEQYEEWTFDAGSGEFTGESYRLVQGEKQRSETLSIRRQGERIVYTATVPTQNEGQGIDFVLIPDVEGALSFENPEHDFPTKIQYTMTGDGLMHALVTGRDDRGFRVDMKRVPHD